MIRLWISAVLGTAVVFFVKNVDSFFVIKEKIFFLTRARERGAARTEEDSLLVLILLTFFSPLDFFVNFALSVDRWVENETRRSIDK
jgi:hypothetical protein